jgi:hypothetical protein
VSHYELYSVLTWLTDNNDAKKHKVSRMVGCLLFTMCCMYIVCMLAIGHCSNFCIHMLWTLFVFKCFYI